jgi:hypothetical protein
MKQEKQSTPRGSTRHEQERGDEKGTTARNRSVSPGSNCKQSTTEQHVQSASVVQQNMTEFSNAETEARKMAIAKLVSYMMKQHGH